MSDNKVWLISQGEYSAYSVEAVADSQEAADRLVDALNADGVRKWERFESYETVPFVTVESDLEVVDELTVWCSLRLNRDGTVTETRSVDERHTKAPRCVSDAPRCQVRIPARTSNLDGLSFAVVGYDHARVRKVMSERRARYLASAAEWPDIIDRRSPLTPTIEDDEGDDDVK